MEQRASAGCAWCKLLLGEILLGRRFKGVKEQPERRLRIKVTMGKAHGQFTPIDTQELRVVMDDKTWVLRKYLTTLTTQSGPAAASWKIVRRHHHPRPFFHLFAPPHPPSSDHTSTDVQQVGKLHCYSLGSISHNPKEPVNRRGWRLQEFLLSPRTLIFTSRTFRFRCQDAILNVGNSLYYASDVRLPDVLFRPVSPLLQPGSKEWQHAHAGWALVVREYSGRTLGEASDKLVACGALAEAFHRVLRCDYLAGLWRDTLFEDLLWDNWTRDSGYVKDRPAKYRAPSWSWAAVDGKITSDPFLQHQPDVVVSAQVVRCHVTLKDPELPFGEVTGGLLVLRAKLIPCKVRKTYNPNWGAEVLLPPLSCGQSSGGLDRVDEDDTVVGDEKLDEANCFVDHLPDLLIERDSDWLLPFWWKIDGANSWPAVGGLIVTLAIPDSGSESGNRQAYRHIGTFLSGHHGRDRLRHCYALEEKEVEIV
ncbi:hypothetical protein TRAPUB_9849 [Trametes pubescens]|uniref:Heterokaryon incompatibility domain-containing protein n=1 Tax=Trametes pubescens TaxID=154538 RepID=A0A1M2W177_TRAPU|nr:hypothetical protein TRAPUB_9849 [Trametes pubescens]